MDIQYVIDEMIKLIPDAKRLPLLDLVEKLRAVVAGAPEDLRMPALQIAALYSNPAFDPDAVTAVEPAITEEP